MSAPVLFARARESAAVLARAETLLRPQGRDYVRDGEGKFAETPDGPDLDLDEDDVGEVVPAFELLDSVKVGGKGGPYYVAAFTDAEGEYGPAGGRVVALTDDKPDWNSGHPGDEAIVVVPAPTAAAIADAAEGLYGRLKPLEGKADDDWEEGPVRVGSVAVDGFQVGAFHDPAGDLLGSGGTFISIGGKPSADPPEWDDDNTEVIDGPAVGGLVAALRKLAGQPVANRVGRPGVRVVLESSLFFARVGQSRQRLAKYDPLQKRDDEGKWSGIPGLASRIQLGEGESLVSSRKFKSTESASLDLLAAEVDTPNGREIRLGVIHPDHSQRWPGGTDPQRDAKLREIDDEIASIEDHDDERLDSLYEAREAYEAGQDRTAVLSPAAVATLREAIAAGEKDARQRSTEVDDFWTQHADLVDERERLEGTPWGQLTDSDRDRILELNELFASAPDWEVTHAEGVIPAGGDGDLVYSIDGNDSGVGDEGWNLRLGVRPRGADEDWRPGIEDDAAFFEPKDVKALLAGLGELVVGSSALANLARLPRAEFTESKVKRDRKGRFAKSAAAVVSELDELMAKLSKLTEEMGEDDDDNGEAETALEALRDLRERSHAKANRREAAMETAYGEVTLSLDTDGDVVFDFDNGSFFMPPREAKQLAGVLDGFRATTLPEWKPGDEHVELSRVPLGDDGELSALLWSSGLVEIGPADNVGDPDDTRPDVLLLEDFDEVADFADLLEELADRSLAETASQGVVTNTAVVLPRAEVGPEPVVSKPPRRRTRAGHIKSRRAEDSHA